MVTKEGNVSIYKILTRICPEMKECREFTHAIPGCDTMSWENE